MTDIKKFQQYMKKSYQEVTIYENSVKQLRKDVEQLKQIFHFKNSLSLLSAKEKTEIKEIISLVDKEINKALVNMVFIEELSEKIIKKEHITKSEFDMLDSIVGLAPSMEAMSNKIEKFVNSQKKSTA